MYGYCVKNIYNIGFYRRCKKRIGTKSEKIAITEEKQIPEDIPIELSGDHGNKKEENNETMKMLEQIKKKCDKIVHCQDKIRNDIKENMKKKRIKIELSQE